MGTLFNGAPPPKHQPRAKVLRVLTSEAQQYVIISNAFWGQMVHYFAGRSSECTADQTGACAACTEGYPVKWLGYLDVIHQNEDVRGFLEMTATASRLLVHQLDDRESLRGLVIRCARTKGGKKGRWIISVLARKEESVKLPEEESPILTLRYLWNVKKKPPQTM